VRYNAVRCALSSLLLVVLLPASFAGQTGTPFPAPPQRLPNQAPNPIPDEGREEVQREMAKKANQERQLQLKRETERLFKLSSELKDYVEKSNEHMLSLDVVKRAEEIEKLAHSVKEKMKGN